MSLTNYVNNIISNTLSNIDKSQQLQTEIHPEINFKYNSINLLIFRRGVGKTFAVLRELIKLSQLPDCAGYTTFLYVSDKTNDATVNELINHIALYVRIVEYNSLLPVLHDLINAKSAYQDAINNELQETVGEDVRKDLFETLVLKDWTEETPHTAIVLDDAINILKDNKFKQLRDLLFQNRQRYSYVLKICLVCLYKSEGTGYCMNFRGYDPLTAQYILSVSPSTKYILLISKHLYIKLYIKFKY
jgi:hypothetical protein